MPHIPRGSWAAPHGVARDIECRSDSEPQLALACCALVSASKTAASLACCAQLPAEESLAAAAGIDLAALRSLAVLRYDTAALRFREAVMEGLGLTPQSGGGGGDAEDALAQLRGAVREEVVAATTPSSAKPRSLRGSGSRGPSTPWIRRWKARGPIQVAKFDAAYRGLVRSVIAPHVNDPRGVLYQREPTFRCHVHGGGEPTGRAHCDAEYYHQRAELNFWVPVTRVGGTNSLYSESAPGRGDYAPFELDYGEVQSFWGNQCRHYTVPNESGTCRVSFDFRVVPRSCFLTQYPGGTRSDGTLKFEIGGFYGWMQNDGTDHPAGFPRKSALRRPRALPGPGGETSGGA